MDRLSTRAVLLLSVALVATVALSGLALAGGRGGNKVYMGPVEGAPVKGFPDKASIEMFVYPKRERSGASAAITHVNVYDVVLTCENGEHIGAGESRGNVDLVEVVPYHPLLVKNGRFKDAAAETATEGVLVAISGTLPKHGAAKGTLSIEEEFGDVPGEPGEPTMHFGTCRSGTLSWSATVG